MKAKLGEENTTWSLLALVHKRQLNSIKGKCGLKYVFLTGLILPPTSSFLMISSYFLLLYPLDFSESNPFMYNRFILLDRLVLSLDISHFLILLLFVVGRHALIKPDNSSVVLDVHLFPRWAFRKFRPFKELRLKIVNYREKG